MIDTPIPSTRYNTTDYPNLEDRADGMVIPVHYGRKAGIIPACIDTQTLTFKTARSRKMSAFHSIEVDGSLLTDGVDYEVDLDNCEFMLKGSPFLQAGHSYAIVLDGTFTINGADYLHWVGSSEAEYADGVGASYDPGPPAAWTNLNGGNGDLGFKVYGKASLTDANETLEVQFEYSAPTGYNLRDAAARTKLRQTFLTGGSGFYLTSIWLPIAKDGTPSGELTISIIDMDSGSQVGTPSLALNMAEFEAGATFTWVPRGAPSKVLVDATGWVDGSDNPIETAGAVVKDIYKNELGGTDSGLDLPALAALDAARADLISVYLDRHGITFDSFIQKMEVGQRFKFLPGLDGKFTIRLFESGAPAGITHYRDEDFISFSMWRELDQCFRTYTIRYDERPENQEYRIVTDESDLARYAYKRSSELSLETYLGASEALSAALPFYKGMLERPPLFAKFEVDAAMASGQIPGDQIAITRSRAAYSGGALSGETFFILDLNIDYEARKATYLAVLNDFGE